MDGEASKAGEPGGPVVDHGGDQAITVVDVPGRYRFEARLGGEVAGIAQYLRRGSRVIFTHTQVDPAFEGRGVGSALAKGALDAVRAAGGTVEPRCPFIAAYLRRHKEYADLLVPAIDGTAP